MLWFLARGTGGVALLLLTASVVLGVANVQGLRTAALPRFVFDGLHRSVSLLVLVLVVIHILCAVLDSYAGIGILAAIVPFTSSYRPLWLGLGAIGFELLVAVAITSLLRRQIGHRAWRGVHWLAYASWPVAVVHGFGTGTDGRAVWMLVVSAACVLAVTAAALTRIATGWPGNRARRIAGGALAALAPVALLVWLTAGPLAAGWARRAGTPIALLSSNGGSAGHPASFGVPFRSRVRGSIAQTGTAAGIVVRIALADAAGRALTFRIVGRPTSTGGVAMTDSLVELGTSAEPSLYSGHVVDLAGGDVTAQLTDGRRRLRLHATLRIDGSRVDGSTTVSLAA